MKFIKVFVSLIFIFSTIPVSYSAGSGNMNLFDELKKKYQVSCKKDSDEGINNGFLDIEKEISLEHKNFVFPETLKVFYREVGHLSFPEGILSPIGGVDSYLYEEIKKQKGVIPKEWFLFANPAGSEYFCINYQSGKVARFLVVPEVTKHDTYSNVSEWIREILLDD